MPNKHYFIPVPTPEQRQKLQERFVTTYAVIVGGEPGLLFDKSQLEQVYQCLNVILGFESHTDYKWVIKLTLIYGQKSYYPVPSMPELTVSLEKWNGGNAEGFMKAAATILSRVVRKAIVISAGPTELSVDDGQFHIAIYKYDDLNSNHNNRVPDTLWGIPVDNRGALTGSGGGGSGIQIYDGDYAVAELVGDTLYVHHHLAMNGDVNEVTIFARLLEKVADVIADQKRQNVCQSFVQACMRQIEPRCRDTVTCLQDGQDVAQMEGDFASRIRATHAQEELIASGKLSARDELVSEFGQLVKLRKVRNVEITSGTLIVHTDVLFCRNPLTGVLHEIGAFKIVLSNNRNTESCIAWFNLTRHVHGYRGQIMQAPHVFEDGHACLGNMDGVFPKLIADGNFLAAVILAIEFIESVNVKDSAGKHIIRWPKAKAYRPPITFLAATCVLMLFSINPQGYISSALPVSTGALCPSSPVGAQATTMLKEVFDDPKKHGEAQEQMHRELTRLSSSTVSDSEKDNE